MKIDEKDLNKLTKKELKAELNKIINEDIEMILRIASSNIFGLFKIRRGARHALQYFKNKVMKKKDKK